MGQSRYERLPKSHNWQELMGLLASPEASVGDIAFQTLSACRSALRRHSDDPVLIQAVRLLALLPLSARDEETARFLAQSGLPQDALSSPSRLLQECERLLERANVANPDPSFVSEVAVRSFQEAIGKILSDATLDLFSDRIEGTERALASYGTSAGYAAASRVFFTSFIYRCVAYFLSKETVNNVGHGARFESLDEMQRFLSSLRTYCWQSSKIIESFAEEWHSKHKWQQKLEEPHFATFTWAVLKKFSAEIGREHKDA